MDAHLKLANGGKLTASTSNAVKRMQRLHFRRFQMALATYAVVISATFLITRFGLGAMSGTPWATYNCVKKLYPDYVRKKKGNS